MDKTIISFLRKEPMATKNSNTDGYKLFYKDTCVGQWEDHHVLITDTEYGDAAMDKFTLRLAHWADKSLLIFKLCSKPVPLNAKSLKAYV